MSSVQSLSGAVNAHEEKISPPRTPKGEESGGGLAPEARHVYRSRKEKMTPAPEERHVSHRKREHAAPMGLVPFAMGLFYKHGAPRALSRFQDRRKHIWPRPAPLPHFATIIDRQNENSAAVAQTAAESHKLRS